jgi:hypothetical protein
MSISSWGRTGTVRMNCRCLISAALLRFHVPLLEPDVRLARIRLSFRISGLCVQHVGSAGGDLIQPQRLVEIGRRVPFVPGAAALFPPHQLPAETLFGVPPEHPIGREYMAVVEVPAPASKDRVEHRDSFLRQQAVPPTACLIMNPPSQSVCGLLGRLDTDEGATLVAVEAADGVAQEVERLLWQRPLSSGVNTCLESRARQFRTSRIPRNTTHRIPSESRIVVPTA